MKSKGANKKRKNSTTEIHGGLSIEPGTDLTPELPSSDFQPSQIIRSAISDTITIPATLQNSGAVTVNIFPDKSSEIKDAKNAMLVEIIYTPEKDKPEEGPLFLSYRNDATMGNIIKMEPLENGTWRATRKMFPDESNEFGLHRVDPMKLNGPPDFNTPDHFQSYISLANGKIISETYPNPALAKEGKTGTLERRIYKNDGSFSRPLNPNEKPDIQPGEEIVHIYLPPEYKSAAENGHTYPVTVMLDGDMHIGTDPYGNSLHTPDVLDNLIAEKKIEPSVVIFTAPTPPTSQGTPRLREYGCDENTASRLSGLPHAAKLAGLSIVENNACILGASMGGIQAIYTAKMYPDVFDKVIAQSPALWWEPPAQLSGDKYHVEYDNDATWRNSFTEKFQVNFNSLSPEEKSIKDEVHYQGFIYNLLATGMDSRTGKKLPQGNVDITLQVGCNETGTIHPVVGKEPLTQATKTLAHDFNIPLKIFDGGHSPGNWATGLCIALQDVHPHLEKSPRHAPG